MHARKIQYIISLIIAQLADAGGNKPSGHIYAELMDSLKIEDYNALMAGGEKADLWEVGDDHMVCLTSEGHAIADEMKRLLGVAP